ncbi:MAG: glycoside hydrolase family 172 protein [Actinomycetota bacterium]
MHPFADLYRKRTARSHRASSWDRTGANDDWVRIEGNSTFTLMEHEGAGCVTHIYCAMILADLRDYRNAILRCFWDSSDTPSVEVPLGDFFAVTHGRIREFSSAFVSVNPGFGSSHGLNAYFPMPFATGARIEIVNRGDVAIGGPLGGFWYHVEYETFDELPEDAHRFHACYRQERPTTAVGDEPNVTLHRATNLDGAENYVALDTTGEGRMVGLVLEVENKQGPVWYGEGDDMVFIDGEAWPPSIHGTGSEEIFGGGACPSISYAGLYSGFHLVDSTAYDGLVGSYRWYVPDPIHFSSEIRWTIEHGHANNFANDYASVAYWYQSPEAALPELPPAAEMLPTLGPRHDEARELLLRTVAGAFGTPRFFEACQAGEPFYRGDFEGAIASLEGWRPGG